MSAISLSEKAIVAIEQIFLDYDVEIEEMPKLSPDNLYDIFRKIYRVVHSTNMNHSCWDVHKDWRKETYMLYEEATNDLSRTV